MQSDLNIFDLFSQAGLFVQFVMLSLLAMSIFSWAIIIQRSRLLKITQANLNNFENKFWLIVRSNINSIDEAKEWFDLVQNNFLIENKIILKKPLKSIILKFIPEKVDKDLWSVWTNKILENFEIKPKVLYITLRQILTGKKYGPSMNDLLTLIRKDEIIKRVESNCEEED